MFRSLFHSSFSCDWCLGRLAQVLYLSLTLFSVIPRQVWSLLQTLMQCLSTSYMCQFSPAWGMVGMMVGMRCRHISLARLHALLWDFVKGFMPHSPIQLGKWISNFGFFFCFYVCPWGYLQQSQAPCSLSVCHSLNVPAAIFLPPLSEEGEKGSFRAPDSTDACMGESPLLCRFRAELGLTRVGLWDPHLPPQLSPLTSFLFLFLPLILSGKRKSLWEDFNTPFYPGLLYLCICMHVLLRAPQNAVVSQLFWGNRGKGIRNHCCGMWNLGVQDWHFCHLPGDLPSWDSWQEGGDFMVVWKLMIALAPNRKLRKFHNWVIG